MTQVAVVDVGTGLSEMKSLIQDRVATSQQKLTWQIAVHRACDFDAVVGAWLLKRFGEDLIPGIGEAEIIYWEAGMAPDGKSWQEWLSEGVIAVDVGGGPLDHHPHSVAPEDCGTTLVAKLLEISNEDSVIGKLLAYALRTDQEAEGYPFGLANMAKLFGDFEHGYGTIVPLVEAWCEKQQRFFLQDYEGQRLEKRCIPYGANGRKLTLVVGQCKDIDASTLFAKAARLQTGDNADVVITVLGDGHVQITSKPGVDFRDIAALVRMAEDEARGIDPRERMDLEMEGSLENSPWFFWIGKFYGNPQSLLNGSRQAAGIEPTKLSVQRVTELVVLALSMGGHYQRIHCGNFCAGERCLYHHLECVRCRFMWQVLPA